MISNLFIIFFICFLHQRSNSDPLPKYDEVMSKSAMFYSAAAYCDSMALVQWNCGTACSANPGILTVRPIIHASANAYTFGFVTYNPVTNKIIVAFRGTNGLPTDLKIFRTLQSFLNWKTNLGHKMSLYETGGKVHHGFNEAYNSIKTQVRSSVKFLLETFPEAQILVTGHSLGGALATLAAIDLKRLHLNTYIQLYTFGSPRVGNRAFAKYVYTLFPLGTIYRVVNAGDIVPHVPTLSQRYVHVGIEIWYPNQNTLTYDQCVVEPSALIYEDPRCSSSQIFGVDISSHLQYLMYPITNLCSLEEQEGCSIDSDEMSLSDPIVAHKLLVQIPMKEKFLTSSNISNKSTMCPGNCNFLGCNVTTGVCRGKCVDSTKWWGKQCDKRCGGHCNSLGCRQSDGLCSDRCLDSTKWWDRKCCNKPCTGNCDSLGCNIDTGLCHARCSDSTKWWGKQCDQVCQGHCNGLGCRQDNGLCRDRCSDSTKWWGNQCDQVCQGHCNNLGCRQDNGLCRDGCMENKWWGEQCENSCTHCNHCGCYKATGTCICKAL